MRSSLSALVLALPLTLASASLATAESITVQGRRDIDKMHVRNDRHALSVDIYGLKPPCSPDRRINRSAIRVRVFVLWGDRPAYAAIAGCYPFLGWIGDLYYLQNRGNIGGGEKVDCPRTWLRYSSARKRYRLFLPRACLERAPDRVRVRSDGTNFGSGPGGTAGPTRLLRRG